MHLLLNDTGGAHLISIGAGMEPLRPVSSLFSRSELLSSPALWARGRKFWHAILLQHYYFRCSSWNGLSGVTFLLNSGG
jgi:hypothetical protein